MIDITTGAITFDSPPFKISGAFDLSDLATCGAEVKPQIINGVYRSFALGERKIGSADFLVMLHFANRKLCAVELCAASGENGDWADWSEDEERRRKEKHDAFLDEQIGATSRRCVWGAIVSVYDARAGASSIIIRYE